MRLIVSLGFGTRRGSHDVRKDLVAQNRMAADLELRRIVLLEPVDQHVEALEHSTVLLDIAQCTVNHLNPLSDRFLWRLLGKRITDAVATHMRLDQGKVGIEHGSVGVAPPA